MSRTLVGRSVKSQLQPRNWGPAPCRGWSPGAATAVRVAMGVQHAVEAALGTDAEPPMGKNRHDLARRQRRELGFIAGEQDPLALVVSEAVRHKAVAAFTAIHAVPVTLELPPPALQGGETTPSSAATDRPRAPAAQTSSRISRAVRRSSGAVSPPQSQSLAQPLHKIGSKGGELATLATPSPLIMNTSNWRDSGLHRVDN